jgi:hypothetical protein
MYIEFCFFALFGLIRFSFFLKFTNKIEWFEIAQFCPTTTNSTALFLAARATVNIFDADRLYYMKSMVNIIQLPGLKFINYFRMATTPMTVSIMIISTYLYIR